MLEVAEIKALVLFIYLPIKPLRKAIIKDSDNFLRFLCYFIDAIVFNYH